MSNFYQRMAASGLCLAMAIAIPTAHAQGQRQGNRTKSNLRAVNDSDRIQLRGNVSPKANALNNVGRSNPNLAMDRMILVLAPRPGTDADVAQLVREQHTPGSVNYQKWLTPEEFGSRFGISDQDLDTVTSWLQSRGFTVDEIATGRGWINFSGNAAQVDAAFNTQMHDYRVNGQLKHANSTEPSIPRALSDLVLGVKSLHNFYSHPLHTPAKAVSPDFTSTSGAHYIAPADFAKIYNVNTLYSGGITGSGQTIAIVGRTDINLADVQFFRSYFGLPANDPVTVHNGVDPGDLGGGEETEADLDVEWSGAVGRNATVKFVVSKSTNTTDGVDLSAQYIVNNNLAAVMSTSFGQCEANMGTTETSFYNNLWSQAAAQGITSFVSSGDSGAAGCDASNATTATGGRAVSGLSSTPFNVAVGGTQFNDTANPATYWSSTTNSTDKSSVLSYIPEIAWNESGNVSGGSGLFSTGGGASGIYAKPSWQSGPGVPADAKRDVPDVSLTSAGHDGYLIFQGHTTGTTGLASVGGTSAASPSFAGLMSLVVQHVNARQGNANPTFYSLGRNQYSSGGAAVYHDATSGNNSVPGVTGFNAGGAYDLATGLGSVDANALVNNWGGTGPPPPPPSQLIGNPGFENGSSNPSPWSTTAGVIDNSTGEAAHAGAWKAWMDGYGSTHTDTVQQTVAIPSTITTATLSFWLHIDTAETTSTTQFDKLQVQVRNTSGTVLKTLATYSNLNQANGYAQKTFDLSSFKGQTVVLFFTASEDSSLQTSFVVDDVNLNVQ